MTEFRMPEAISSLSLGSFSSSDRGNGTRSRSVTTMSKSANAFASSSESVKCRSKVVTSTRSAIGDQSAAVVATRWKSSRTAQRMSVFSDVVGADAEAGAGRQGQHAVVDGHAGERVADEKQRPVQVEVVGQPG